MTKYERAEEYIDKARECMFDKNNVMTILYFIDATMLFGEAYKELEAENKQLDDMRAMEAKNCCNKIEEIWKLRTGIRKAIDMINNQLYLDNSAKAMQTVAINVITQETRVEIKSPDSSKPESGIPGGVNAKSM